MASPPKAPVSPGFWPLRPGDLPRGRLRDLPSLQGLEENPVYRLLLFQAHRQARNRSLLVAAFLGFWFLLGAPYFAALNGGNAPLSLLYAFACALLMAIGIADLFWLLGIQGYETNGRLRAYFGDIVQIGAKGETIAKAVHASALSRTNFRVLRFDMALLGGLLALGLFACIPLRGSPYMLWAGQPGIFGAALLVAALGRPEALSLPGSLLWLGGVRRSYERRVLGETHDLAALLSAFARLLIVVAIGFSATLVPLALYGYAGHLWVERRYPTGLPAPSVAARFAVDASVAAAAGLFLGFLLSRLSLRLMPAMLRRLEREMGRLFELRRQWLHERRGP